MTWIAKWKAILCALLLALAGANSARAAGTIPLSLVQQFDANGDPLRGALLYSFVAGTVATAQNSFQDFGLTIVNPNPVVADSTGRIPQLWYADGLVHVRLTDASGVVVLDTTMQVVGPSGGGGGGGGTIDPTTIAATGDMKFRLSSELLAGWVIANATTIGSATSGATQRANADTQNLFVYLWGACPNAHCPVLGGRGATALADFNANKQITLPNMQARTPVGRDCMNTTPCAGLLLASNITSGGGDGVDTPGAFGGVANQQITLSNLPSLSLPVSVSVSVLIPSQWTHSHTVQGAAAGGVPFAGGGNAGGVSSQTTSSATQPDLSGSGSGGGTATLGGGGVALPVMGPFQLGTFYVKL